MLEGNLRRTVALVLVVAAAALAAIGASSATAAPAPAAVAATGATAATTAVCDTGHVYFAKTKFVFHAGLAFGVFHRYIYKPFRAGAFKAGSPGRLKAAVKAAIAAAFVYHELKLACKDAENSSLLRPLLAPLSGVVTVFSSLEAKLKTGQFNDATLQSAEKAVAGVSAKSSGLGLSIPEIVTGFTGG